MPLLKKDLVALSNGRTVERGIAYFRENRANILSMNDGTVEADVEGSEQNPYRVSIRLSKDGNSLLAYDCDCPAFCEQYTRICKHVVATVLTVQSRSAVVKIKRSDNDAIRMLNEYIRSAVDKASEAHTGHAILEPVLEYDYEQQPALFFRVGEGRMYVIQDLPIFAMRLSNQDTAAYGKYTLWHRPASFCEKSRQLVAFFLKRYNTYNYVYSGAGSYRYYGGGQNKRNMYLSPAMADELFDLLEGGELAVRDDQKRIASVRVRREDYRPSMRLSKTENGALLECDERYLLLEGDRGLHIVTRDCAYSCGEAFTAACGELLRALQRQHGTLFLADKELAPLFSMVLPRIEPFVRLTSEGEFAAYHPEPLETKIYLDTPGPGSITARMTFTYGGKTHSAFEEKQIAKAQDLPGEIVAEQLLSSFFGGVCDGGILRIDDDPDAAYRLVTEGVEALSGIGQVFASEDFGKIRVQPPANVSVGVRVDAGLLALTYDLEGVDVSELPGVLASYRARKKYHLLRDGSFLPLDGTALAGLSDLAEGLDLTDKQLVAGHASLASSRAIYLDAVCKRNEALRVDRDKAFKQIIRNMKDVENADYAVPDGLRRVLRNYQKTGYRWLKTIGACGFGGILADDMGLGKTLQVLALLAAYAEETGPAERLPSIVVCPASLCLNWESEVKRFTPGLRVCVATGTAAERKRQIAGAKAYDLLITSYDLLKRDVERYGEVRFAYVIIDEAQYIKNQTTQNAKSVKALAGKYRFALTGTPVENSLAELWSIFDFLMPGYLFTYSRFRKRYEEPIVKTDDREASERLKQLVRPFLLRRMKKEVLRELPPKTETTLRFEMEAGQKRVYLAAHAHVQAELRARLGLENENRMAILAALTRLRQICCDPALLYENYDEGSAKLQGCMELVESCMASGQRILLFSQFTSMLDILQGRLEAVGVEFLRIDGGTRPASRLEMVNAFNAGSVPVFLISLKAGGTGLNLTGADVVIHYDPWWNLSAQNQATDRAHRIGQKNPVQVYKLIMKDTIEERILEMQRKKAALIDAVVAESENPLERLRHEELLALLEA